MIEITTLWGVVYNDKKEIVAKKTPENTVYPAKEHEVFSCDTYRELEDFITENNLHELTTENY